MPGTESNVDGPSRAEIGELGAKYRMDLDEEDIEAFADLLPLLMESYERVAGMAAEDRSENHRDAVTDHRYFTFRPPVNPHNVWITQCSIPGAEHGPLAGYEVGLKDNIMVAGMPMTCGCEAFREYVPVRDATIVSRLLNAGATITGKLAMDAMAFASSGELSYTGPVTNPRAPHHLAGGSSSGPAAAVAAGEVDVAIGTDQAGSIRIPASFCGCVGLKPTHGLVPYTGIVGQGYTFDHVGPLADSVADCARVLSAIAGREERHGLTIDSRQRGAIPRTTSEEYLSAVDDRGDIDIGVVSEGFDRPRSEPGTDETVRDALIDFEGRGVALEDISIPPHTDGMHVWACVIAESNVALFESNGVGYFVEGEYDTGFAGAFGEAMEAAADTLPRSMQLTLIVGRYMADRYHGRYHALAQNLRRTLRRAYDAALESVDVLALPTTIYPAYEQQQNTTRVEEVQRAYGAIENTSPFDMTGHPAISVPCGTTDGLPVGVMFVAERFDEATLLRVANQFESDRGPITWAS